MKRDCWASQSPSRNASLSPLVLGRNLWRSAEWLPALLIILCSSSIVSLYRAAMVEGWIFPWFEYLGQQQQRVGALVASSTGQDVFGKCPRPFYLMRKQDHKQLLLKHEKHLMWRGIMTKWALTEISVNGSVFGQPWKLFKICSTFPVSLISRALFPPTVPISPPGFPACSFTQSLSGGL